MLLPLLTLVALVTATVQESGLRHSGADRWDLESGGGASRPDGILPPSRQQRSVSGTPVGNCTINNSSECHMTEDSAFSVQWEEVKNPFIYTAFILIAALCKIGYHHADFLSSIVPESCLLIILGSAVGGIFLFTESRNILPQFTTDAFFLYLLPPIILESAYSLHDRAFFSNLGIILLYAILGTLINCFSIGPTLYGLSTAKVLGLDVSLIECLVFSALISAVDPVAVLAIFQEVGVNKVLYFLVFGESLLNDAVTVVLYRMMVRFIRPGGITADKVATGVAAFLCSSLGALIIGLIMGIVTALVTKHTENVRVVEPLAMLALAYLSYLTAELVHFSGIISIIACGIVQAHYAKCNISQKSSTTVKYFSKMLSSVCDSIIFLFLGLVLVNNTHQWNIPFALWATFFCLIYRFLTVFSLTFLANKFDRVYSINVEEQFLMAYGGLRGAVAFCLAIMLDEKTVTSKDVFVTSTLFVILFTVFIQGATIKPLVNLLKIRRQGGKSEGLFTEVNNKVVNNIMAGVEEVTGSHGGNYWTQQMFHYNQKYLKKWLQRDSSSSNLTRVYTKVVLADHFAHLYGPATAIEDNQSFNLYRATLGVPVDGLEKHDEEEEEEDLKESAEEDTKLKLLRKNDRPKFTLHESPPPLLKRHTTISMFSPSSQKKAKDDTSKLLQKALQDNPYNKYHLRYNRNLVDDENQELGAHLRARRLRARRLTLVAMCSVNSSTEEDSSRPSSAPVPTEQKNSTAYFLRRAKLRRSFRTSSESSADSLDNGRSRSSKLERQRALSDSMEDGPPTGLEAIAEENSPDKEQSKPPNVFFEKTNAEQVSDTAV